MKVAAAAALLLLLVAPAAARPLGDFGRAAPSVFHDEVLPALGDTRARLNHEPVSRFNQSDEEREMSDRIWRFLVAPHSKDWFYNAAVELQRTRLTGPTDETFAADRYYRWLHRTEFASSRTRYNRIADDVLADTETAPTTFAAICAVIEMDEDRAIAAGELPEVGAETRPDRLARRAENRAEIGWFTRALRYRYTSYSYALDHLLVETPHKEGVEVDARLGELLPWVKQAERGEFCLEDGWRPGRGKEKGLPGRILLDAENPTLPPK